MKFPNQSPSASPPEAEIDLEQIEDALRQLEVLPVALWSPRLRAEWRRLKEEAARSLLDLHARGLIRLTRSADGRIEVELLDRTQH